MSKDNKDPKASNNDIATNFGKARRAFTSLHRTEVDRANLAQQRARLYRQIANTMGVMERFYSDEHVNILEAGGETQFLISASVSGLSMAASGDDLKAAAEQAQDDEEGTLWDVASLQSTSGAIQTFAVMLAQNHGLVLPTPLDLSVETGAEGSIEAHVRELLGRVSTPLADQHAEAWRLFREGIDSGRKAGLHLLRETFRQLVQMFAPDDAITKQSWYRQASDTQSRTTHGQRIRYIRERASAPLSGHVLSVAEQLDKMEIELLIRA